MKHLSIIIVGLLLILSGCRNQRGTWENEPDITLSTYISLQIHSDSPSVRTVQYYPQSDWKGVDLIEEVYLFCFDVDNDERGDYIPIKIDANKQGASVNAVVPWRTKPGRKIIYTVANPSPAVLLSLRVACATSRSSFDTAYRDTIYRFLETDNFSDFTNNHWGSDRFAATRIFIEELAQKSNEAPKAMYYVAKYGMVQPSIALTYIKTKKTETEFNFASRIMMTGEPVVKEIEGEISASEAPTKNKLDFTLKRTVSQVVVVDQNDGIKVNNSSRVNLFTPLLRYAIIHQEPTSYLLNKEETPSGQMISPGHGSTISQTYVHPRTSYHDYRTWNYVPYNTNSGATPEVNTPLEDLIFPTTTRPFNEYQGGGYGECFLLGGQFLPESSQPTGSYTWDNTSLIVVQVFFVSTRLKINFNTAMYVGKQDGRVYDNYPSAFRANNPAGTPIPPNSDTPEDQVKLPDNVITYPGACAYYVTPVNPMTGEVQRNQVYKLHVTALSGIGFSGIPLPNSPIPCDPDDRRLEPLQLGTTTRAVDDSNSLYHTFELTL